MKLLAEENINVLNKTVNVSMSVKELIFAWTATGGLTQEGLMKCLQESKDGTVSNDILASLFENGKKTHFENGSLFDDLDDILSEILNK